MFWNGFLYFQGDSHEVRFNVDISEAMGEIFSVYILNDAGIL